MLGEGDRKRQADGPATEDDDLNLMKSCTGQRSDPLCVKLCRH
jgi:hypothetical protein